MPSDAEPLTRQSLAAAARLLARRDEDLAGILSAHGPPPLWRRPGGYRTLFRIILEQQVSLASARSLGQRVEAILGGVTPARMIEVGEPGLRSLGLTRQKSAYCVDAARHVLDGRLVFRRLARQDDAQARDMLMHIKGIGPWSADIYLLMALGRRDVWPAGDLALVETLRRVKRLRGALPADRLERIAAAWRPYRAVAARMLWQHYLAGGTRGITTEGDADDD